MFIYLFVSSVVLTVSVRLFRRAAGSLSLMRPNMISYVFYYNIILQTFIASVLVVANIDNHHVISRLSEEARFYGWISVMYMMITLPIGMLLSRYLFSPRAGVRSLLGKYADSPVSVEGRSGKALKYSVWCFTGISIAACIYTFWVIGYYPFAKAFTSSASELGAIRFTATREFAGNVYVRNTFALTMTPVLAYAWVVYYKLSRSPADLVAMIVTLFFATSILYYNFEKSPLLWFVLSFVFLTYYLYGRLNVRYAAWSAVVVAVFIATLYIWAGVSPEELISYNTGPVGRVILVQSAGLFASFDVFPDQHSFIGFASISRLLSEVVGFEYVERSARIVMMLYNPWGIEAGTAGVMNTIFIGEAWANFGIIGILLSPLWVGFLLQTLNIFFLKSPKNPVYLAFFVSFSVGGSVTGGVNDYLYSGSTLMSATIFVMIMLLAAAFRGYSHSSYRKIRVSVS